MDEALQEALCLPTLLHAPSAGDTTSAADATSDTGTDPGACVSANIAGSSGKALSASGLQKAPRQGRRHGALHCLARRTPCCGAQVLPLTLAEAESAPRAPDGVRFARLCCCVVSEEQVYNFCRSDSRAYIITPPLQCVSALRLVFLLLTGGRAFPAQML